ncbi:MAG TPA: response regulator transcription factor [Patescibacteria group bacterium]
MPKILLLEDDSLLARSLVDLLHTATYSVEWVSTLHEAWFQLKKRSFDILILDRHLEDGDGLEVIKYIHERSYQTKMIVLSQKGHVVHRIEGLQAGADEYLAKPFSLTELMLRLEKLNARTKTFKKEEIKIGHHTFYPQQGHLYKSGEYHFLRKRESAVFMCFCVHANQVLSRTQIARWAWPTNETQPTNKSVDTYIKRLRSILGKERDRLETVRGYGYRLQLD